MAQFCTDNTARVHKNAVAKEVVAIENRPGGAKFADIQHLGAPCETFCLHTLMPLKSLAREARRCTRREISMPAFGESFLRKSDELTSLRRTAGMLLPTLLT
jgi:hypothetical protein